MQSVWIARPPDLNRDWGLGATGRSSRRYVRMDDGVLVHVVEWLTLLVAQPQLPEASDVEVRT